MSNEELVAFPDVNKISENALEILKLMFPNYTEAYDDWLRFEFICVPVYMIGFDWKKKLKELGLDALKQEFIKRGYNLKRRVQTLDYESGNRKKIKVIMWIVDKKVY